MKSVFAKPLKQKVAEVWLFFIAGPTIGALAGWTLLTILLDILENGMPTDTASQYMLLGITAIAALMNIAFWTIAFTCIREYETDEEWADTRRRRSVHQHEMEAYRNG